MPTVKRAGLPRRFAALLLDTFFVCLILAPTVAVVELLRPPWFQLDDNDYPTWIHGVIAIAVVVLVLIVENTLTSSSVGKSLLGLRIKAPWSTKIGQAYAPQAPISKLRLDRIIFWTLRSTFGYFVLACFGLGILAALLPQRRGVTFHDQVFGTIVLQVGDGQNPSDRLRSYIDEATGRVTRGRVGVVERTVLHTSLLVVNIHAWVAKLALALWSTLATATTAASSTASKVAVCVVATSITGGAILAVSEVRAGERGEAVVANGMPEPGIVPDTNVFVSYGSSGASSTFEIVRVTELGASAITDNTIGDYSPIPIYPYGVVAYRRSGAVYFDNLAGGQTVLEGLDGDRCLTYDPSMDRLMFVRNADGMDFLLAQDMQSWEVSRIGLPAKELGCPVATQDDDVVLVPRLVADSWNLIAIHDKDQPGSVMLDAPVVEADLSPSGEHLAVILEVPGKGDAEPTGRLCVYEMHEMSPSEDRSCLRRGPDESSIQWSATGEWLYFFSSRNVEAPGTDLYRASPDLATVQWMFDGQKSYRKPILHRESVNY